MNVIPTCGGCGGMGGNGAGGGAGGRGTVPDTQRPFAFRGEEILGRRGWDARCDAVCAPKSWDAALGIRAPAALDALRGCRARLLGEFARVAAREPPFLSRAAAARVREARRDATEAADDGLFFPFDPDLLFEVLFVSFFFFKY